jgi:hypothetical protein
MRFLSFWISRQAVTPSQALSLLKALRGHVVWLKKTTDWMSPSKLMNLTWPACNAAVND